MRAMFLGLRTVVYPVGTQLEQAKEFYSQLLGLQPYFDQPFYVGFNVGGYELGLIPDEDGGGTYWGVASMSTAWSELLSRGATPVAPPKDVGEGIWVAVALDPFGNPVGIIENPHFQLPAA